MHSNSTSLCEVSWCEFVRVIIFFLFLIMICSSPACSRKKNVVASDLNQLCQLILPSACRIFAVIKSSTNKEVFS